MVWTTQKNGLTFRGGEQPRKTASLTYRMQAVCLPRV